MPLVLLVDDDPGVRSTLARFVTRLGHRVVMASDANQGVDVLRAERPDLVVTDMEMPGGTGFVVLEAGLAAGIPVVILTAHASVEMAVEAMKRGAANFLTKPFGSESVAEMLLSALNSRPGRMLTPVSVPATGTSGARPERAHASTSGSSTDRVPIGEDDAFRSILSIVERVADTDATILITGESGTGKEVVARAIHNASHRREKPFVAVNCGAIPEALLESELFGHVRGAFTGATQARRGRFAAAEGGTLFLDEIGDMPAVIQVKLLRVIQERAYEVLGDSNTTKADLRFIAATHRNLEKLVEDGGFREDLYYRLNVVPLHLPPLRERVRDIPLLVEHFIGEANDLHRRAIDGISPEALALLGTYAWPGNVRELCNLIERMVVLRGRGPIEAADVPAHIREPRLPASSAASASSVAGGVVGGAVAGTVGGVALPSTGIDLGQMLQDVEGALIAQALDRTRGNRTQAAALLRIHRTTLVEKLKRRDGGEPESD